MRWEWTVSVTPLSWPAESAAPSSYPGIALAGSNICLDFHGDPLRAELVLFSDGNHHMALEEALRDFLRRNPAAGDVFYTTTPPRLAIEAVQAGGLRIGNLSLSLRPNLAISPPAVLDRLVELGALRGHRPFVRGRGSALLVPRGNPLGIHGIADLARKGLRLFISNPKTEAVSHSGYAETLRRMAAARGIAFSPEAGRPCLVSGDLIHHREAPEFVAGGWADAAIVYHHLALRYVSIFPEHFEMVPLGQAADPDNLRATIHIGLAADPGPWGRVAFDYLLGDECAAIYDRHGLDGAN